MNVIITSIILCALFVLWTAFAVGKRADEWGQYQTGLYKETMK